MSGILAVGSVALDTVETPFGRVEDAVGGSAVFFSAAASLFDQVRVVGVVGTDYPLEDLDFLRSRGTDLTGLEVVEGESFRWEGRYKYDLNARETVRTELGVFADFRPRLSDGHRDASWVFLGNIEPRLQLEVLEQVESPRLVAADTMNYWIEGDREGLLEVLGRVDLMLLSDAEARELSGDHNLARAADWILGKGPSHVVIKKGEHGAMLFGAGFTFFAPGYPLEEIYDPTGAGDAFAGGLIGHLARAGSLDEAELRRAVVHGCALGSFACEDFGPRRLEGLAPGDVAERVASFREMTRFEHVARVEATESVGGDDL